MKKHPVIIVLQALINGAAIELGEMEYCLSLTQDLLWRSPGVASDDWFHCDMTLGNFIGEVLKLSSDEVFLIGADSALNLIKGTIRWSVT